MNKILGILLNTLFILVIVAIVIGIATFALTKKINDYATQYNQSLTGTVVKNTIPVMSFTSGIVEKINVQTGDNVNKGEELVSLSNPPLVSQLHTLMQFPSNVSAETQASVDEQQLKLLTITAPTSGIVGDITISQGSTVDTFTRLLTIYSNSDIQLLANLTVDEYQAVMHATKIEAYSQRLNQSFVITPKILNPDEKTPLNFEQKKIGLYFSFVNNQDAESLLNNEDLTLQLESNSSTQNNKPVTLFVNFWNYILHHV